MINTKVWYSLDGRITPIVELDTQHLVNAICCVERGDARYGVKHGAALPALRREVATRATRGDLEAVRHVRNAQSNRVPTCVPDGGGLDYAVSESCNICESRNYAKLLRFAEHYASPLFIGDYHHGMRVGRGDLVCIDEWHMLRKPKVEPSLREVSHRAQVAHDRITTLERRVVEVERHAHPPQPVVAPVEFDALVKRVNALSDRVTENDACINATLRQANQHTEQIGDLVRKAKTASKPAKRGKAKRA